MDKILKSYAIEGVMVRFRSNGKLRTIIVSKPDNYWHCISGPAYIEWGPSSSVREYHIHDDYFSKKEFDAHPLRLDYLFHKQLEEALNG